MLDLTGTEAGTETGNETGTETGTEQNNCASRGNPFCWLGDTITLQVYTLCTGTTVLAHQYCPFLPPGEGEWEQRPAERGKGQSALCSLPHSCYSCGGTCTSQKGTGISLHSRNGRMVYILGSPGCLRKTEETQKERMASVAVRMMWTNPDENYTDPNSFWTNHYQFS